MDVRFSDEFTDPGDLVRKVVKSPEVGVVVVYVGIVKGAKNGKSVRALTFEVDLREAERELRRVLSEIARKYDIVEIVFEHRLSPASPGERIVQIAIAARDRRSALKALEEIVKAFKSSPHIRRRDIYAEE